MCELLPGSGLCFGVICLGSFSFIRSIKVMRVGSHRRAPFFLGDSAAGCGMWLTTLTRASSTHSLHAEVEAKPAVSDLCVSRKKIRAKGSEAP